MWAGKPLKTIIMRGLAFVSFLTVAIVMFVSYQKVEESCKFKLKYNNSNGLMFFAVVNAIGCFYNLLVLVSIPPGSQLWKTTIALDVIVNILVGTSLGAGWQAYILISEGNIRARWGRICPYFCGKVLGSLLTSTFGFAISIALHMCTLHVVVNPCLVSEVD